MRTRILWSALLAGLISAALVLACGHAGVLAADAGAADVTAPTLPLPLPVAPPPHHGAVGVAPSDITCPGPLLVLGTNDAGVMGCQKASIYGGGSTLPTCANGQTWIQDAGGPSCFDAAAMVANAAPICPTGQIIAGSALGPFNSCEAIPSQLPSCGAQQTIAQSGGAWGCADASDLVIGLPPGAIASCGSHQFVGLANTGMPPYTNTCRQVGLADLTQVGCDAGQPVVGGATSPTCGYFPTGLNGNTAPGSGSLSAGCVLQGTGSSSYSCGPITLDGGGTLLSGALPLSSVSNPPGAVAGNPLVVGDGGVPAVGAWPGSALPSATPGAGLISDGGSFSAAPYVTVLNLDLTKASAVGPDGGAVAPAFAVDGDYTFSPGSSIATKINTAGQASPTTLTDAGTNFYPSGGTTNYQGTFSLPALMWRIDRLMPNWNTSTSKIRVWVHPTVITDYNTDDAAVLFFMWTGNGGQLGSSWNFGTREKGSAGSRNYQVMANINTNNYANYSNTWANAANAYVMAYDVVMSPTGVMWRYYSGTWSGGWPSPTALLPHYAIGPSNPSQYDYTFLDVPNGTDPLGCYVGYGAMSQGGSSSAVFANFRVDVLQ